MGHAVLRLEKGRCICGREAAGPESRYLGLAHAFCSADCAREFERHPWAYDAYIAPRGRRGMGLLHLLHPEPVARRRRAKPVETEGRVFEEDAAPLPAERHASPT